MTRTVRFTAPDAAGIGRIILDRPDDAVNAVNAAVVDDLGHAIRLARACGGLRGLIVASGKPTQFVAGADLKMVTRASDPDELMAVCQRFQAVLDELAWLPCTVVAAINGPALGAGMELALACDYRVVTDGPTIALGQPEVNLGLVPAGGGTQRLPRLIGLVAALDLILNGRRLNARRARRLGVVDDVVHLTVLEQAAVAWATKAKRPLDRPIRLGLTTRAALDLAELTPAGRELMCRRARAAVLARTHGHYPAPLAALEAVRIGLADGMAAGLEAEARAFADLARMPTAKNLIWLFLATQRQKRRPPGLAASQDDNTAEEATTSRPRSGSSVERLGVVGAGFMGTAIAAVAAAAGLGVRLRDVQPEAVGRGLSTIRRLVNDTASRRRLDRHSVAQTLQRVSGTTDYSGFATRDLVIEAVFEDVALKQKVVAELEAVLPADRVIASNTSAIPIHQIAAGSTHPERIVGMHFFSPAERMPLVEIIRPTVAADWAVSVAVAAGMRLGKTVIVVADSPGFYTSRVLGVMLNEAALMLGEGARIEAVDGAMTAFGFPVGPFVLFDEVGLEVAEHVARTAAGAFGARVQAANVVPRLVAAGLRGRKSGAGFYLWRSSSGTPDLLRRLPGRQRADKRPNAAVYGLLGSPAAHVFDMQVIQERLALLFVSEAIRCLEEGVLQSPADGDLGAVLGLGFPPFRGGPFHYADALGLPGLVAKLRSLSDVHGRRYEPPRGLVERALRAQQFFETD